MTDSEHEDLPSNPYADEAKTAPRLADRPGYPFAAPRQAKADLGDEAQIGKAIEASSIVSNTALYIVRGRIKFVDPVRGYGFITRDDGMPDIFFHRDILRTSGFIGFIPGAGSGVEVEAERRGRGMAATRVRWLEWKP